MVNRDHRRILRGGWGVPKGVCRSLWSGCPMLAERVGPEDGLRGGRDYAPIVSVASRPGRMEASGHSPMTGPPPPNIRVVDPVPFSRTPRERVRTFMQKHGRKLWWLHSAYALGLGIAVVAFAQKGFDHARWLAVSIGAAWLLVVLFFRL